MRQDTWEITYCCPHPQMLPNNNEMTNLAPKEDPLLRPTENISVLDSN